MSTRKPDRRMDLSHFCRRLPRSGIREIMDVAAGFDDVVSVVAGEPSFDTPAFIIDAALADARAGHTHYTPSVGIAPLRDAVAARCRERWGQAVASEDVLIGAGAVNAVLATFLTLVDRGDEVLLPDPGWPNYWAQVQIAGGTGVAYPLSPDDGYLPDLRVLDSLLTARSKVIVINNPSNPCGVVWPADAVSKVAEWARERKLWMMSDEIYEDLVFEGEAVSAARWGRERTIVIGGCSKSWAMTGWRIGWAVCPPHVVRAAAPVLEALVSCACEVSQRAALAALTGPEDVVGEMRDTYRRRRDLVRARLQPEGLLPVVPTGAFYALVDLRSTGLSSHEAAMQLIREERLATVPGSAFGRMGEGFLRVSLAHADEKLEAACERLVRFARRHAGTGSR